MYFTSIYPSLYSKTARCKVDSIGSPAETSKDVVMINKITAIVIILLLLPALSAVSQSLEKKERLEEIVGRLFINYKSLKNVYRDLHDAALDNLSGSDQQLSYIQKTYLFVNEANLMCFDQWKLLSIIDYIKDERKSDYFTLRIKDLDNTIFESKDRINSLKLYYAYIENTSAKKSIDEAIGLIEANIYIYEKVLQILKPMSNPPNLFNSKI